MFDPDKKYKVRSTGKAARFLGTLDDDAKTAWAVRETNGREVLAGRDADGKSNLSADGRYDIIPAPVETSKFLNVYGRAKMLPLYTTLEEASRFSGNDRLGVLEYKYEDDVLIDLVLHKTIA